MIEMPIVEQRTQDTGLRKLAHQVECQLINVDEVRRLILVALEVLLLI